MAFRLKRKECVEQGLKRILLEQMNRARDEFAGASGTEIHDAIHQARKCCKKIRGFYRLVRSGIPGVYRHENRRVRDAAQALSAVRDTEAVIEAYDRLMERVETDAVVVAGFGRIRPQLVLHRDSTARTESDIEAKVSRFLATVKAAKTALNDWALSGDGFEAIEAGLQMTYSRGRKARRRALADPTVANFHEWRKRVKYHWFHIRALRGLWPGIFDPLEKEIKKLGMILGTDHDLSLLENLLRDGRGEFAGEIYLEKFFEAVRAQQQELKREALSLGERVYASKPKDLVALYRQYWRAWRTDA